VTRADLTERLAGRRAAVAGRGLRARQLAGRRLARARDGDIAVTAADRKNFGLTVGSTVSVVEQPAVEQQGTLPTVALRVTGIYRQTPAPYWDDQVLAGLSGSVDTQPPYRPAHDTWLTAPATFTARGWIDPVNSVSYNLDRRDGRRRPDAARRRDGDGHRRPQRGRGRRPRAVDQPDRRRARGRAVPLAGDRLDHRPWAAGRRWSPCRC
jgi:hypothetical protein